MATRKVTLLITDSDLVAYEWDSNGLVNQTTYSKDAVGIIQFGKYLDDHKAVMFSILLNSVEEEYQLKTMPHLAKKQKYLLKNNIDRTYREFTYKYGIVQGRESFGKKEDIILLMSMPNAAVIDVWVQPLLDRKISITGINSLPLSTEIVVQKLAVKLSKLLVITRDNNGLRLTYLDGKKFKISRLVKTEKCTKEEVLQEIYDEVDRTLLYLGRLRLLFPDQKTDILFIGSKYLCQSLDNGNNYTNNNVNSWLIFDADLISKKLNLSNTLRDDSVAMDLFTYTFLNSDSLNHYANEDHLRYFRSRKLRFPLEMTSASLFLLLALYSAVMYIDAQVLEGQRIKVQSDSKLVASRLFAIESQLPVYPISADAVRAGVQSVETLLVEKPNMQHALFLLSKTIKEQKNIHLDFLQWGIEKREVVGEINENMDQVVMEDSTEMTDVDVDAESAKRWVQVIIVKGRLVKFGGNYTLANKEVDGLVNSLNKVDEFHSVVATQKPINQKPEKRITGRAGEQGSRGEYAEFSLEIITDDSKLS